MQYRNSASKANKASRANKATRLSVPHCRSQRSIQRTVQRLLSTTHHQLAHHKPPIRVLAQLHRTIDPPSHDTTPHPSPRLHTPILHTALHYPRPLATPHHITDPLPAQIQNRIHQLFLLCPRCRCLPKRLPVCCDARYQGSILLSLLLLQLGLFQFLQRGIWGRVEVSACGAVDSAGAAYWP